MKKILAYALNKQRYDEIHHLISKQSNDTTLLLMAEDQINQTPQELLESDSSNFLPANNWLDAITENPEFMLLYGFQRDEIFSLVDAFSSAQLARPIMATVTTANMSWKFSDLMQEVISEHNQMTKASNPTT